MRPSSRVLGGLGAVGASLVIAGVVLANEFCYGSHSNTIDGFRGNQNIRTDPATVSGVAYAHPAQVQIDLSGNFIGIGTYKGAATTEGYTSNCVSHYDPADWSGYYDYTINGVYNCFSYCANCWVTGSNPPFQMLYTYCPTIGNRWVLWFDGVRRGCVVAASSGDQVAAGLETTYGATDRNIDVKWTNMAHHVPGASSWAPCVGNTRPGYADPNYTYQYVSDCAWNTYLSPLD